MDCERLFCEQEGHAGRQKHKGSSFEAFLFLEVHVLNAVLIDFPVFRNFFFIWCLRNLACCFFLNPFVTRRYCRPCKIRGKRNRGKRTKWPRAKVEWLYFASICGTGVHVSSRLCLCLDHQVLLLSLCGLAT